ncbi:hypothetical protein LJ207_05820 [Halanaerobium sp. Z-7514]|uniref:Uncharacterized protein n=1 Tax=Halanaerobium polyolivorans TaxID=2886943 RepID=A0AAW4WXW0_9FIRM|nr:hypothetical protein [Halanaerobium polyolivorans]MCC3144843.1 hypothetical protein [Halanaerobium polyolivorans]RQD72601.1 MAG: hypothetical protein D5S01_09270 [Halanaerobium sp. MSAO_Bac5]
MFKNIIFSNTILIILICLLIAAPIFMQTAHASSILDRLFKTLGIGVVVDRFAEPINDFINTLTLNRGVEVQQKTKVVPIVTVGSGTYVGAVQVAGPEEAINRVEAVAQLEGDFRGGDFRIRALVPINTKNPGNLQNVERIEEVGVTALIDINI